MRATTYEITRWVEIRLQHASQWHAERWYIWNDLTECEYLGPSGTWQNSHPAFFDTPEDALAFWNKALIL